MSCLYEEADSVVAYQLRTRPGAFAVLSHDSDFAVMRDSRFIPIDWFDVKGDLMAYVTGKKRVGVRVSSRYFPREVCVFVSLFVRFRFYLIEGRHSPKKGSVQKLVSQI